MALVGSSSSGGARAHSRVREGAAVLRTLQNQRDGAKNDPRIGYTGNSSPAPISSLLGRRYLLVLLPLLCETNSVLNGTAISVRIDRCWWGCVLRGCGCHRQQQPNHWSRHPRNTLITKEGHRLTYGNAKMKRLFTFGGQLIHHSEASNHLVAYS